MNKIFRANQSLFAALSAVVLAFVGSTALHAQEADAEEGYDEYIEEIITTGTAGGAEVRKFDASFAITTMNDQDINKFSPKKHG